MCDYSLHAVQSRPAKIGDKLMSTSFVNSFTRGFASADEPGVAVCLRPGTEVAFEQNAVVDHGFGRLLPRLGFGRIGEKVARFRQINTNRPDVHHDALEFPNGKVVLITRLAENQRLTVLQLPAEPVAGSKEEAAPSPEQQNSLTG
ncbi:MAG TPA: hypothetical protein VE224_00745 [Pseudolabrys sp.]|nr:hypothetical protein [Pseudolabrys sp.]